MTKEEITAIAKAISNATATTKAIEYDVPSAIALMTIVIGDALAKNSTEFSYSQFLTDCEYTGFGE
jgi:hypothetical protein